MTETPTTSTTTVDSSWFSDAVRAVITEMEYDGLPVPITIKPYYTGRPEAGVEVQVRPEDFVAWASVLGNQSFDVTSPAHEVTRYDGAVDVVEHARMAGTINEHRVAVITVRPAVLAVDRQRQADIEALRQKLAAVPPGLEDYECCASGSCEVCKR